MIPATSLSEQKAPPNNHRGDPSPNSFQGKQRLNPFVSAKKTKSEFKFEIIFRAWRKNLRVSNTFFRKKTDQKNYQQGNNNYLH